ncbi:MAG: PD-(D/E)XK nuclease family protein [Rhodoferax sp.]|uniref:RecB family exonuclease n=1 Tax=Rhodoferax sp. TaxID=50421 RepID=UPI001B79AAA6|nr:PD-(D/E)XK nuclease family protein [Rhodoferax sp.]MBP9735503.1 PD-(D/E)XK nuclease family protein [Rhodoferax sp.]
MKIRLGLELDGQHREVHQKQLDAITTGPLGMLNLLETQLGLLHIEAPTSERILQYRQRLKQIDSPTRFYHQSFLVDELGTAATLLAWRDQWHLHGWCWHGTDLTSATSRRLRDMSALEGLTQIALEPGIGERLHQIHVAMQVRKPRIASVTLLDELSTWPKAWRVVLQTLPLVAQSAVPAISSETPQNASMLAQVQGALCALEQGQQPHKLKWQDDGTLRIVQSETRALAGNWLADELAKLSPDQASQTLLLAPDAAMLDDTLAAASQARQGFSQSSAARPALQVLPLALGQLWNPLNLIGLLEFLTHPICPIPGMARTRLANMLTRSPGMGQGQAWDTALQDIQDACTKLDYDWEHVRHRIRVWLEHDHFEPAMGAPLEAVITRVQALADYFHGRTQETDPAKRLAFISGQSQTLTCLRSLRALVLQGDSRINPQQLQTLLDQATSRGSANPLLVAELGACRGITSPGAATEAADHVIWWQLKAQSIPNAYPWSLREQTSLREAGVDLPAISDLLSQQAEHWQRPITAARRQLTLILPRAGSELHPLWLMLESLFDKQHPPKPQALESLLTSPDAAANPKGLTAQPYQPLPAQKRMWQLPPSIAIARRETESFSSLESFLFNPYQWVLTYPAALKASSILDISDSFLLYGTLAHHLVEHYVTEPFALTQSNEEFLKWFEPAFDTLIADEGAILLMPGRNEDLASFRRKLCFAMQQLRAQLHAAHVIKVEPEVTVSGQFVGGKIAGSADLLLTRKDGQQAIVDMKWSGGKKYPDKLALNRHLQLAIYGELQRQKTGQWPRLAYFILNSAELLATDQDFFPQARLVRKNANVADEGAAHLWERFLISWKWRRQQLDQGLIEVALEENDDSTAPEDGMAMDILNQNYNDYRVLAGWGEDA